MLKVVYRVLTFCLVLLTYAHNDIFNYERSCCIGKFVSFKYFKSSVNSDEACNFTIRSSKADNFFTLNSKKKMFIIKNDGNYLERFTTELIGREIACVDDEKFILIFLSEDASILSNTLNKFYPKEKTLFSENVSFVESDNPFENKDIDFNFKSKGFSGKLTAFKHEKYGLSFTIETGMDESKTFTLLPETIYVKDGKRIPDLLVTFVGENILYIEEPVCPIMFFGKDVASILEENKNITFMQRLANKKLPEKIVDAPIIIADRSQKTSITSLTSVGYLELKRELYGIIQKVDSSKGIIFFKPDKRLAKELIFKDLRVIKNKNAVSSITEVFSGFNAFLDEKTLYIGRDAYLAYLELGNKISAIKGPSLELGTIEKSPKAKKANSIPSKNTYNFGIVDQIGFKALPPDGTPKHEAETGEFIPTQYAILLVRLEDGSKKEFRISSVNVFANGKRITEKTVPTIQTGWEVTIVGEDVYLGNDAATKRQTYLTYINSSSELSTRTSITEKVTPDEDTEGLIGKIENINKIMKEIYFKPETEASQILKMDNLHIYTNGELSSKGVKIGTKARLYNNCLYIKN